MRELAAFIKKEFKQLIRDKNLLRLIIVAPIIQVIIFGYVVKTEVKNIPIAIYDGDKTAISRQIKESLVNDKSFKLVCYARSDKQVLEKISSGQVRGGLIIPEDFSEKTLRNRGEIVFLVDGSDANVGNQAASFARSILANKSIDITINKAKERGLKVDKSENNLITRVWYNPELESVNYMVPGVIGIVLSIFAMLLTSTAIIREKERGTLEQLMVTPLKRWQFITGKIFPYVAVVFVDVIAVILICIYWFEVGLKGSIILLLFSCLLLLFSSLGFGIFISTVSENQHQAQTASYLFNIPVILLSGFMFPIKSMPGWVQFLTYAIPLRYFLEIIRGIFLKGSTFIQMFPDFLALFIFSGSILYLSINRFKKKVE